MYDRKVRYRCLSGLTGFLCLLLSLPVFSDGKSIRLLSTTSTENSGLLAYLLPQFTRQQGIRVHVVAQGTGMALRAAERGDGDLLLVHDVASEEAFIAAGFGHSRRPFMYNDFVIVGPRQDPAGISGMAVLEALERLHEGRSVFVSRADDSGTHKREMRLWRAVGLDPRQGSMRYREVGSGMGKTLNISATLDAYTLSDRGTWLSFNNRQNLEQLVAGDEMLFNQYSVIEINRDRHPHIKGEWARALSDWLISEQGQAAIDSFRIGGQALFHANFAEQEK